ncbi:AIPR family protein [Vagococcus carniphilus]|uniref:AIPR family protein n=1 Tax=Vagococcus carniphilus TaxID=218144 RepID=A0AAW8UDS7_9ENTE|nr:AIPR family protein [Vagococcus carniphilus]MDT2835073.1 AIPR family protein [Vagococcus carniphilus]
MTKIKFKVKQLIETNSPSNPDINIYYAWINFRDLPKNISLEVNPRKPKMNTSVARQIINAVISEEITEFDVNNRGIVITAKSLSQLSETDDDINIEIDFGSDLNAYGILDGGHTYTAIINYVENLPTAIDKFVRLEIIIGENIDVTSIADARNTSSSVSDIALFELDDKFGFVKKVIDSESYAHNVDYKDNDVEKSIPIAEILKLMFTFNTKRFPDDSSVPTVAYAAKASIFKDYQKNYINFSETNDNIYVKLAPFIPDFVELYELIEKDLPNKYQEYKSEEGKTARFGGIRGVATNNRTEKKYFTNYTKEEIDYQIPTGYIMPIFGAFRSLLVSDSNGNLSWSIDFRKAWEETGVRLTQNTFDTGTNPQLIGKNKPLWQSNYRIVDSYRKDQELIELRKRLSEK